jgi:hypothetical protein
MGKIIAVFILLAFGGCSAARPDLMVRFQIWTQRVIMHAQYIPSARTHSVIRGLGVFFILLGFVIAVSASM